MKTTANIDWNDGRWIRRYRIFFRVFMTLAWILVLAWIVRGSRAYAHCDTMDGPVITDAREALNRKDVTPVLKWIRSDQEEELKATFLRALAVRTLGDEARELADRYFFETAVRLHRTAEGAAFTGLQPPGTHAEPIVQAADAALSRGDAEPLVRQLTEAVAAGLRQRFTRVQSLRNLAETSVEAGRAYVTAYVDFIHHVTAVHGVATAGAAARSHADELHPDAREPHGARAAPPEPHASGTSRP